YQDVRVEDNPHPRLRTLRMVFRRSAGLKPTRRASLRALATRARNSLLAGASIRLRITTSPSPMTTNCTPASRPRAFRTSSGMTTCPLDESLVVATAAIVYLLYSYQ